MTRWRSGRFDGDAAAVAAAGTALAPKDRRYDPIVGAGLVALARALAYGALRDPRSTAILGVTDRGCASHVARVAAGIAERKPRQAFFVRAGAQTLATYAAMALDCHGPTLTLSGGAATARTAWHLAHQLLVDGAAGEVIVLAADQLGDRLISAALVVSRDDRRELPAPGGVASPAAYLYDVVGALAPA